MEFHENELYHIYNRGNNKRQVFLIPQNYQYFLRKVQVHILPFCDILAYSLMPNHFHFVISSDSRTVQTKLKANEQKNVLSEGFRSLLSSYAQVVNKQNKMTGSLFQQNTKAKCLHDKNGNYGKAAFHYVHQNAYRAGLVNKMEFWLYSSFPDYIGWRNDNLCNKQLAFDLLDLDEKTFYQDSYAMIDHQTIAKVFV